jgi:hypothetical protein
MDCLRFLAERGAWFDEGFDYEAAACHELSIAGLRVEASLSRVVDTEKTRRRTGRFGRELYAHKAGRTLGFLSINALQADGAIDRVVAVEYMCSALMAPG